MTDNTQTEATQESRSRQIRRLKAARRTELLGDAEPTPSDLSLIRRAALAELALRDIEERYASGEPIDPTALVRVGNMHHRAVTAFRSGRTKAKPTPRSFVERMAARQRKIEQQEEESNDDTI